MKRSRIGLALVFSGILFLVLSYLSVSQEEHVYTHTEDHLIPPRSYYEYCLLLIQGDNITISVDTNTTIGVAFTKADRVAEVVRKGEYINITMPGKIKDIVINTTDNYCILFINMNNHYVKLTYVVKISRFMLTEANPLASIIGLVLLGTGLFALYSIPLSKGREYPSTISSNDIICKTISINKHECTILLKDKYEYVKRNLDRVIEYVVDKLGYAKRRELGKTIVVLERGGSVLPTRDYSKKKRTIIISVEQGLMRINYILSILSAAGTMDLEYVYKEVESIKKNCIEELPRIQ